MSGRARGGMAWAASALGGLAAALCLSVPARAAFNNKDVGTSGAQFLKIGPGARPAGMGEAFSSVAGDIHGLYYNPAGLARMRQVQFGGMHNQYFQSLDYNFGAVVLPVARIHKKLDETPQEPAGGVLGLAVYNLSVDDIPRRGLSDTDNPTGVFGASDLAYGLSYARPLGGRLAAGGTVKVISQRLDDKSATSFAADVGGQWRRNRTSLGLGWRNLGTSPKFGSESDPLPLLFYVGASHRFFDRLTLAADVNFPRDNDPTLAAGVEYAHPFGATASASLRAGYYTQNTDPSGLTGVSLGAGLGFKRIAFDFAWVPFGDLGNTFRYSLLLRF